MRFVALLPILLAGVLASPAAAAGWSPPALLLTERCEIGFCSPAPDVAVNRHGTVIATYRRDDGLRTFVRIGDGKGRFGPAQALPAGAYPAQAAIADDGTAILTWAQRGHVRVAFRRAGTRRFGRSIAVARLADRDPAIDDVLVGLDRTGGLGVVAWSDFARGAKTTAAVRAIDARRQTPVGPAMELDAAQYLRLGDLAVNRAGHAALTWVARDEMATRIGVVTRDAAGFSAPLRLSSGQVDDPAVAVDPAGAAAVAYTAVTTSGDAGARGVPVLRVRPSGAAGFGPELRAPAPHPNRVFNPQVAFAAGGRATLLFQQKDRAAGFSRAAPLRAAVASADGATLGAPATVVGARISEPRVAGLDSGRVLTIWQTAARPGARLAGARSDAGGAFRSTAAPAGSPDPFSDASGNRALAAAGRYAAFIWGGGGRAGYVRISVRRF